MPIPAAPAGGDVTPAGALQGLFRQLHASLRDELRGLDDDAVNWVPTPGANSIATVVVHLLGSEAETFRCVAGVDCVRDRDAEFTVGRLDPADLAIMIDTADGVIEELGPRIDEVQLQAAVALPTLPPGDVRSGLTWLVGNYGHAREHVGQIQLTKQLYLTRRAGGQRGLDASIRNLDA